MAQDDFQDLFADADDVLQPSSQGSLTAAAADLDLHPDRDRDRDSAQPAAPVIDQIEAVMEHMVDALLNDKNEISVTLKSRRHRCSGHAARQSEHPPIDAPASTRTLRFPGRTEDEAWRFSVVLRIMQLTHQALRNDVVMSKRDIFYRDPALFGSQTHVDRYVDDIAYTFGVSRSALNVTAAAKGLVAGSMQVCRRDGSVVDAAADKEGMLVPGLREILSVSMAKVRWILVVEKEATFRSIAGSDVWQTIATHCIILTGKGYPDLSTRAFLRFLSTPSLHNGFASPPVYGLADFDPDGIAILSVYKHGSKALAHESAEHAVPGLQWLGLRSTHLDLATADVRATQGLLALSSRDQKKAITLLGASHSAVDGLDLRRELQTMLMLNVKAELQFLHAIPQGLQTLLRCMAHNPQHTCHAN